MEIRNLFDCKIQKVVKWSFSLVGTRRFSAARSFEKVRLTDGVGPALCITSVATPVRFAFKGNVRPSRQLAGGLLK